MADKARAAQDKDKRGGYSGSKPGSHMAPPAKLPSGFSTSNGSKEGDKR